MNTEEKKIYELLFKDVEELSEANVADTKNKLRYSSILKFKGLEKEEFFGDFQTKEINNMKYL